MTAREHAPVRLPRWLNRSVRAGATVLALSIWVVTAHSPTQAQTATSDAASPPAPAEPADYRMNDYRSPTPATLAGARVLTTSAAQQLWQDKAALFVDVMPRPPRPANLPEGTIFRQKERKNIPGSLWLPNVGFGVIPLESDAYFRHHLERVTNRDKSKPLVLYCLADCWMSWNAAKRALTYGYRNVFWYPDGTDGWIAAGGDVAVSEPAPAVAEPVN